MSSDHRFDVRRDCGPWLCECLRSGTSLMFFQIPTCIESPQSTLMRALILKYVSQKMTCPWWKMLWGSKLVQIVFFFCFILKINNILNKLVFQRIVCLSEHTIGLKHLKSTLHREFLVKNVLTVCFWIRDWFSTKTPAMQSWKWDEWS